MNMNTSCTLTLSCETISGIIPTSVSSRTSFLRYRRTLFLVIIQHRKEACFLSIDLSTANTPQAVELDHESHRPSGLRARLGLS
jgi:hypothetical protein